MSVKLPHQELHELVDAQQNFEALQILLSNMIASPGDVKATAAAAAPTGWLLCDGSAVSRQSYSGLFGAVGVSYGMGDGSTTFNLPDFRGRVLMGSSGSHALASSGGEESHVLTVGELPSHSHGLGVAGSGIGSTAANGVSPRGGTISTDTAGSDVAHNNLQPYVAVNWLIKV